MQCSKGRISPTSTTKLRLFADSGGYCQNPKCLSEIFRHFEDSVIHIGEIAHVIGASYGGPRADKSLSDEGRSVYENLILLCPTCHTVVDKAEQQHPKEMILQWKGSHRDTIASAFGIKPFATRSDARRAIAPLLKENKTIFDTYGPLTDERFNPESTMPQIWIRKVRTIIVPNNRKLLSLCDASSKHLSDPESATLEVFRQHVDDFEAKHIDGSGVNGIQFPPEMAYLFSDSQDDKK